MVVREHAQLIRARRDEGDVRKRIVVQVSRRHALGAQMACDRARVLERAVSLVLQHRKGSGIQVRRDDVELGSLIGEEDSEVGQCYPLGAGTGRIPLGRLEGPVSVPSQDEDLPTGLVRRGEVGDPVVVEVAGHDVKR